MRIVFRVDATVKIGTGHLMRCLALAHELGRRGAVVEFVSRRMIDSLADIVLSKGYKLSILPNSISLNEGYLAHSQWLDAHWREDAMQTLLQAKGADWLIVDHYALDEKWELMLHPHVDRVMVIDDIADRKHKCSVLLDQNYFADAETRYSGLLLDGCDLLLTPKFALLREEFAYTRATMCRKYNEVKKILVFFGGIDASNEAGKALEALKSFRGEITVVAGSANENYPELERFCAGRGNIQLIKSVDNMAAVMADADLAIGGGGATSWERATLGLPTLGWPIASNQIRLFQDLESLGVVKITSPEKLREDLERLTVEVLKEMSQKALQICDAQGAKRVADKLWN